MPPPIRHCHRRLAPCPGESAPPVESLTGVRKTMPKTLLSSSACAEMSSAPDLMCRYVAHLIVYSSTISTLTSSNAGCWTGSRATCERAARIARGGRTRRAFPGGRAAGTTQPRATSRRRAHRLRDALLRLDGELCLERGRCSAGGMAHHRPRACACDGSHHHGTRRSRNRGRGEGESLQTEHGGAVSAMRRPSAQMKKGPFRADATSSASNQRWYTVPVHTCTCTCILGAKGAIFILQ